MKDGRIISVQHTTVVSQLGKDTPLSEDTEAACKAFVCNLYAKKTKWLAAKQTKLGSGTSATLMLGATIDHSNQLKMTQIGCQPPHVLKPNIAALKQNEVEFCTASYHSFLSVENRVFQSVLHACLRASAR